MKIIHTSDWHIGKFLNDYSLLDDQRYFADQFLSQMEQLRPDAVMIAGDIYDRAVPSAESVSLLHRILNTLAGEMKIPVFLIAGNHDSGERLAFGNHLLQKSGLYIEGRLHSKTAKFTLEDRYGPVNFYLLPYFDRFSVRTLFPEVEIKTDQEAFSLLCERLKSEITLEERNVLMMHGFFGCFKSSSHPVSDAAEENPPLSGASAGGSELMDLSLLPPFDYIALGHIHGAQKAGADYARYSGSPLKYSIDEARQEKQYELIELTEKGKLTVTPQFVTPLHDVKVLSGTFSEISSKEFSKALNREDYFYFHLLDQQPVLDVAARLKSSYPNLLGVQFTQYQTGLKQNVALSHRIKQDSPQKLFEEFFLQAAGKPLTDVQSQLVTEILQEMEEIK